MIELKDYGHTIVLYDGLSYIAKGSESDWNALMQNLDSKLPLSFGDNLGVAFHARLEAFYLFDPLAVDPIFFTLRPQEVKVFHEYKDKGIREFLKQLNTHYSESQAET